MKKAILLSLVTLLFCTCKKKNNPVVSPEDVISQNQYYGLFIAEKYRLPLGNNDLFQSKVFLHAAPRDVNRLIGLAEDLGPVKSNNITLKYSPPLRMYMDTTGTLSYSSQVQFEHSSTQLGTINFSNPHRFIDYPDSLALTATDSIDKSQGYVIPLAGITGYDEATCIMSELGVIKYWTKTVPAGSTSISFTASELADTPRGKTLSVRIILKKYNDQKINDKIFRFENDSYIDLALHIK